MSLAEEVSKKVRAFWLDVNSLKWIQGIKHPATPITVFRNVWSYDRDRKQTRARCSICDCAISDDEMKRHELVFVCDGKCLCQRPYVMGINSHKVCDVCDSMYRAMYINYGMKNRNYFRNCDDEQKKSTGFKF